MDGKLSLKGAWSGTREAFKFGWATTIAYSIKFSASLNRLGQATENAQPENDRL